MSNLEELQKMVLEFRDARDWKQFHNPKDSTIALVSEAMELLDQFKWKNSEEMRIYIQANKNKVEDEVADCLYWILLISADLGIDIKQAVMSKMAQNEIKYPVKKSKGRSTKYSEL